MTLLSNEWMQVAAWIHELHQAGMPSEEIYTHVKGPDGGELAVGAVEGVLRNINLFGGKKRIPSQPTPEEMKVQGGFVGLGKVLERATPREATH